MGSSVGGFRDLVLGSVIWALLAGFGRFIAVFASSDHLTQPTHPGCDMHTPSHQHRQCLPISFLFLAHRRMLQEPLLKHQVVKLDDLVQLLNNSALPDAAEPTISEIEGTVKCLLSELANLPAPGGAAVKLSLLLQDISANVNNLKLDTQRMAKASAALKPHMIETLRAYDKFLFTAMFRDSMDALTMQISRNMFEKGLERPAVPETVQPAPLVHDEAFFKELKYQHVQKLNKEKWGGSARRPFTEDWFLSAGQLDVTQAEYSLMWRYYKSANKIAHQPADSREGLIMLDKQKEACIATLRHWKDRRWCIETLKKLYQYKISPHVERN